MKQLAECDDTITSDTPTEKYDKKGWYMYFQFDDDNKMSFKYVFLTT